MKLKDWTFWNEGADGPDYSQSLYELAKHFNCRKGLEIGMPVSFIVEGLPQSPNATMRQHWAVKAKAKKEWQEKIGWLAKSVKTDIHPLKKAIITFSIHTGDNRRHDPDNLAWAVSKPTLDAIKGILIEDDSIDNVELIYQYHRDKPRRFKVTIEPRS